MLRGDEIVSGHYYNNLRLWNKNTGACLRKFDEHKSQIVQVTFHPYYTDGVISVDEGGCLLLWSMRTGEVYDQQAWPEPVKSASWDIHAGCLALGLANGVVLFAEIPAPQYPADNLFNAQDQPRLPPWRIRWIRGSAPLDANGLNIQDAQLDADTAALVQQRGAVGEATVRPLTTPRPPSPYQFQPINPLQVLATLQTTNLFFTIHTYLAQKQQEKPVTAATRVADFTELLLALRGASNTAGVNRYVQQAQKFYHSNPLNYFSGKRNRYFHLRVQLRQLSDADLQTAYQEYCDYFCGKVKLPCIGISTELLPAIEQLRQQLSAALGLTSTTASTAAAPQRSASGM